MPGRTFAIGDIHGDLDQLFKLLACFPELHAADTLVFTGDYIDSGPESAEVVAYLRRLPSETAAKVVTLRGNHEDGWLRVIDRGWPEFVLPPQNGCLPTLLSFLGRPELAEAEVLSDAAVQSLLHGAFFPPDIVTWMRELPFYYEDDHAIYVHAGLPKGPNGFLHPSEVKIKLALLWCRDEDFFRNYRGKLVVFGHTATELLPLELSTYTPEDPTDLWAGPCAVGLDTGCGKGGFLTAIEFPGNRIYESR
jgi:serine/threonine protein phosphatase 1